MVISLGVFSLTFPTQPGPVYRVERKNDLDGSPWQLVTNVTGTGAPVTVTDDSATGGSRFYRIQVR